MTKEEFLVSATSLALRSNPYFKVGGGTEVAKFFNKLNEGITNNEVAFELTICAIEAGVIEPTLESIIKFFDDICDNLTLDSWEISG